MDIPEHVKKQAEADKVKKFRDGMDALTKETNMVLEVSMQAIPKGNGMVCFPLVNIVPIPPKESGIPSPFAEEKK